MRGRLTASTRRRTNLALLWLLPTAVLTGLFSNTIGVGWPIHPAFIHAVTAIAIAVLTPWKAAVIRRGLNRRRPSRWASLGLLILVAVALLSGLTHSADLADRVGPLTIMQLHVGAALLAVAMLGSHYRSHPVKPRPADVSRRNLLRVGVLGAAAAVTVGGWEWVLDRSGLAGGDRRFTGSHERSSFRPTGMPTTIWFDDRVPDAEAAAWTIDIDGRAISVEELMSLPTEDVTATLDCTSGWYSEQTWTGVRLDRVIAPGSVSVEVRSSTGYARRFPTRDAVNLWLATGIGGKPLSPGHGYPVRLIAPGRRGFWWVKWVDGITTSDVPWWIQSPFPVT